VTDYEIIAREISGYWARLDDIEKRLAEVERVNARLEAAALSTARASSRCRGTGTRCTRRCVDPRRARSRSSWSRRQPPRTDQVGRRPTPRLPAMPDLPLTGGCLCGGVRFELIEPPVSASYCHCTRCQRRTGTAASAQARIVPGSLRILSGKELLGAFEPTDGFGKVFCSACGSALWSRDPADGEIASVRLGVFDSDPGVRPAYRQYVAYAAEWEPIPDDGLPRHPEARPSS
jgi:hypothetical protein